MYWKNLILILLVVYAFGAKDAGRLKGGRKKDGKTYYQITKDKGDIKDLKNMDIS